MVGHGPPRGKRRGPGSLPAAARAAVHNGAMVEAPPSPRTASLLPNFCQAGNLLRTMLIAQLLAFILVAVDRGDLMARLQSLALTTLFIQWVAVVDAALLCALRRPLARLDLRLAAVLAFAVLQAVTLAATVAVALLPGYGGDTAVLPALPELLWQNGVISAIVGAVALRHFYVTAAWQRQVEAETAARVQALQARIRPHFLFNSMNTIASLTRSDPAAAEAAVEDLAELFRAAMAERVWRPLQEELDFGASYLRIEALRLGDRLRVAWDLDPAAARARLPALSLQPLLENAVYHGIERCPGGGTIQIATRRAGRRARVVIDNPVAGAPAADGHALAQDNVRQRLALAWGERARLDCEPHADGYRVTLEVPADEDPGSG